MQLTDLFIETGRAINSMFITPYFLYFVYFIAFFFGAWIIINVAIQKVKQFQGKPGKVISTMVTVITVGSIFYSREPEQLLTLFNSFGGFIIILLLGIIFIGAGVGVYYFLYFKLEKNERKISHKVAILFLSIGIFIGASLLVPHFPVGVSDTNKDTCQGLVDAKYCYGAQDAYLMQLKSKGIMFNIFGEIFSIAIPISLLAMIISLIALVFNLGDSQLPLKNNNSIQSDQDRKKHISDYKEQLNSLFLEMQEINNLFNQKINLLNQMQRRKGGL
ncbi:MAG: hypothetical protein ACOC16_00440 [Nanoarchaeota archaeon]